MTQQNESKSRGELTPPGVLGWRIWSYDKRGMTSGTGASAVASIHRTSAQQPVVRYTGPDGVGHEMTAELRMDSPAPGCWELWLVGIDESGREKGWDELLAWCSWPNSSAVQAAEFLIPLHRESFQFKWTDTEIAANTIIEEFMQGMGDLVLCGDGDDEE